MLLNKLQDRIELDSRLTELTRVQPWIDALADQYGFSEDTRFAMHLCVEEALANVVMHGYRNEPGHPIVIRASVSERELFLVIEDEAPAFAPVEPTTPSDAVSPVSLESIEPGGNGIRLLYRFAGSLAYERFADGNRLTIGFPIPKDGVSV
jgi:anti-sigma regulatory factor (Ser/Thr protein kinase)